MSESDTPGAVRPNDLLGPLPERTLAEIHNPATGERELSETGAAYYGGNWREVRKLYTADDMRDYGRQERAAERERWRNAIDALANSWDDPDEAYGMRLALNEVMKA